MTGLIFSSAILLVALFLHNPKIHSICMCFLDIMLLGVGLLITLVSAPEQLTITLIPVVLLVPLFFDSKPYKFLIIVLLTDLIYMLFAPIVKPSEILALDMVDVLVFSISGLLIGIVVTKAKIERYAYAIEFEKMAIYDGLTGCYNRVAYNKYIEDNAHNINDNFVVIMLDINGLKAVNDSKGHKAGDEMIITVAKAMKSVFEKFGKCYRMGGDEFIAFVKVDESEINGLIESLRKMLKENDGKYVKDITVSVGYSTVRDCETKEIEALISIADKKMYENKALFYSKDGNKRRG